ncbi:hypothetical protein [Stenotrophomonas sp. YAU14A_MKIMI4_1]|uniref:hypothetical protein n=1 Tax=Stenotrophomonas sp. YAU14A_MKIMI4_1 TaxID=2072408 RepID=UPI000D5416FD|nr:hypothetical protein [Stenotrophomonas sp. YAU14A_MKIMI4_1]AWH29601.1 hypothetical protein C1931_12145 [Stenotrophomonas sp. YAU14A_MKIMI4_1]
MADDQIMPVLGFDLGGVTSKGRLVAVAIKFGVAGGNELMTVWDQPQLESLLSVAFEQARQYFDDRVSEIHEIARRVERSVVLSRPDLLRSELTDPSGSARVCTIDVKFGPELLLMGLTFPCGMKRSVTMSGAHCLLLYVYATKVVTEHALGIPTHVLVTH